MLPDQHGRYGYHGGRQVDQRRHPLQPGARRRRLPAADRSCQSPADAMLQPTIGHDVPLICPWTGVREKFEPRQSAGLLASGYLNRLALGPGHAWLHAAFRAFTLWALRSGNVPIQTTFAHIPSHQRHHDDRERGKQEHGRQKEMQGHVRDEHGPILGGAETEQRQPDTTVASAEWARLARRPRRSASSGSKQTMWM